MKDIRQKYYPLRQLISLFLVMLYYSVYVSYIEMYHESYDYKENWKISDVYEILELDFECRKYNRESRE